MKENLTQLLCNIQDLERDNGIYKEWYDKMLEVENRMYDKRYMEVFSALPDNIINTFIEYLNWLKIEFLRLTAKKTNEVEDLIYRNGLFTATTKFLEMFAEVKATRDHGKTETDKITGVNIQDKQYRDNIEKQEGKNV